MDGIENILEAAADTIDLASDSKDPKGCLVIIIAVAVVVIVIWLWNR
jgi:hypothetical protein